MSGGMLCASHTSITLSSSNLKVGTVMTSLWVMKASIRMRSLGHDNVYCKKHNKKSDSRTQTLNHYTQLWIFKGYSKLVLAFKTANICHSSKAAPPPKKKNLTVDHFRQALPLMFNFPSGSSSVGLFPNAQPHGCCAQLSETSSVQALVCGSLKTGGHVDFLD